MKCRKHLNSNRSAFSLVEMMVAMLSGSILLLLVGSLLILGHRSWLDGNRRVELQRDATLAMEAIGFQVRSAQSSAPTVSADNSTLFLGNGTSVSWSGNQLIMNPGGTLLVRDHVLSFQARIRDELPTQPVHVILQLFDATSGGSSIMTGTFLPRNLPPDS